MDESLDKSTLLEAAVPETAPLLSVSRPPLPLESGEAVCRDAAAGRLADAPVDEVICVPADRSAAVGLEAAARGRAADDLPDPDEVGILARVVRRTALGDGVIQVGLVGCRRVVIESTDGSEVPPEARARPLPEVSFPLDQANALMAQVLEHLADLAGLDPRVDDGLVAAVRVHLDAPGLLADRVGGLLPAEPAVRTALVSAPDPIQRLRLVNRHLETLHARVRLLDDARGRAAGERAALARREELLRAELAWTREALGVPGEEGDGEGDLDDRIRTAGLPPGVERRVRTALRRAPADGAPGAEGIRRWVEEVLSFPWSHRPEGEDAPSIETVREALGRELVDLEEARRAMTRALAEARAPGDGGRIPALCLVGPPGTGKSTAGRTLARAAGRPFVTCTLSDLTGPDDLLGRPRGSERAGPGLLARALAKGVEEAGGERPRPPVILLESVEALDRPGLEGAVGAIRDLLDPDRPARWTDRWLEGPVDLSGALVVATARHPDEVPPGLEAVLPRVVCPELLAEERVELVRDVLLPRGTARAGLPPGAIELDDAALRHLVDDEGGGDGHTLAVAVSLLARAIAGEQPGDEPVTVDEEDLERLLPGGEAVGVESPAPWRVSGEAEIGVATGLGWGSKGGVPYRIEWLKMPGQGDLTVTGSRSIRVEDTVRTALSYVSSRAEDLKVNPGEIERHDFHVHVPDRTVASDGPAAGLPVVLGLASLLTDRPLSPGVAASGGLTLRGHVTAVRGVREKVQAARRAGIRRVFLPSGNGPAVEALPDELREQIGVVCVNRVEEVLAGALMDIVIANKGMPELKALSDEDE